MAFGSDLSLLPPGPLNNTVVLSKRCNGVCPFREERELPSSGPVDNVVRGKN
jgi:hypothetical protein